MPPRQTVSSSKAFDWSILTYFEEPRLLSKDIQIVLFSATFPNSVVDYASKFAPNANQITLKHEELTVEGIKQLDIDCRTEVCFLHSRQ